MDALDQCLSGNAVNIGLVVQELAGQRNPGSGREAGSQDNGDAIRRVDGFGSGVGGSVHECAGVTAGVNSAVGT